jgi:hypothetical protein
MPSKRRRIPQRRREPEPELEAAILAFITGDREYFVRTLGLMPWQDSPLVDRPGVCTHGHPIVDSMPNYGCGDQHEAHALRQKIIAELERLGSFRFADLDAEGPASDRAWAALEALYRDLGLEPDDYLRRARRER